MKTLRHIIDIIHRPHFTHRLRHVGQAFILLIAMLPATTRAQYNCTILKDSTAARACRLYNASDSFAQGSPKCERYLDSAIAICPAFAPAWHERSVPYLKRGDFVTWRRYLDRAVALDSSYLAYRGWCRFEFLRDYRGALRDLQRFDTLYGFPHMTSNNGDYELHIVMALCERALGHNQSVLDQNHSALGHNHSALGHNHSARAYNQRALAYFDKAFGADSTQAGLYGYLYLGTTLLRVKDYRAAITALDHENRVYDKFAETWFFLARANLSLGNTSLAKTQLLHAKALLTDPTGKYYLHDVYCEMQDAIYLSDVERAIARLPHE